MVTACPGVPGIRAGVPLIENANVAGSPTRSVTADRASTTRRSPASRSLASDACPSTIACTQHGPVGAIARRRPVAGTGATPDVPIGAGAGAGVAAVARPAVLTAGPEAGR